MRKVGVESAHSFGDTLFNAALIKAMSLHYGCKIGVAVKSKHADGFINLPWVAEIININNMRDGHDALKKVGYQKIHQITQNIKFPEFKTKDPNHSLIDTPLLTGREIGIPDFDQRPIFIPTHKELAVYREFETKPTIAIESVYTSAQSWATKASFDAIVAKYKPTHRILWLSNSGAPPGVDDMLRFTRREVIMCLRLCDEFFSVGSGFFCASLALHAEYQPKKITCLWIDDLYKYEYKLSTVNWHNNINWIHNHDELLRYLL